jgi:NAD(P) transhydrogenase subunit alpha
MHNGVKVVGTPNLPATMPINASELYSRNLLEVVKHLCPKSETEGEKPKVVLNLDDEIIGGSIAIHNGEILHEMTAKALETTEA